MNLVITLLFWIAAPALMVWAVATLHSRPTTVRGLTKLILGTTIVFLTMQEDPAGSNIMLRLLVALHTSLAASAALLGLIDLLVVKLPIQR
jgi:hypothetical protein